MSEVWLSMTFCSEHLFRVCRSRLDATSLRVNFLERILKPEHPHRPLRAHSTTSPPSSETQTDYATFDYVEDAERPPIFLIQESPPRSCIYRKQGLHGPENGARGWGKRA